MIFKTSYLTICDITETRKTCKGQQAPDNRSIAKKKTKAAITQDKSITATMEYDIADEKESAWVSLKI